MGLLPVVARMCVTGWKSEVAELVDAPAGGSDDFLTGTRNHPGWEVNQETGI